MPNAREDLSGGTGMVQLAFVSISYLQFDYAAPRNFGAREALC
jgi:hypothetical protein